MTRLIEDVLREHADTTPAPHLDVAAIIAAGDRKVRRSRVTATLAAASVTAAVIAGGVAARDLLPTPETGAAAASDPFTERRVSWATGELIHWGAETYPVGRPVRSYVQTDDGFVFTTPSGEVWFHDGAESHRIGHTSTGRLRADDTGSLVAWVGADESGAPEYVAYDTALGREVARVEDSAAGPSVEPADRGAEVFAVDDGSVYWRAGGDRIVRHDVASGETTEVHRQGPPADPAHKRPAVYDLADVADGQLAFLVDGGRGAEAKVGPTVDVETPTVARASNVFLSPDATFLAAEEEDFIAVYDVATRADVTPDLTRYPFAVGYGWVDTDTLMAFGIEGFDTDEYAVDMLSCDIGADTCELVGETVLTEAEGQFVLPVGDPMDT